MVTLWGRYYDYARFTDEKQMEKTGSTETSHMTSMTCKATITFHYLENVFFVS